ncbi:hypothetical protein BJ085DRAFT_14304, partial [Dimargaris cristalligena]
MSIYRVVGTVYAVLVSLIGWHMTTGNKYGLFIVSIVFSAPAFYVIIFTPHKGVGYLSSSRLWTSLAGIVVALLFNAWLWPRIARVELRHFTALGLDTLGNIYSQLTAKLPYDHLQASVTKSTRKMQDLLGRSQIMLQESMLEPRLRGPFPAAVYTEILGRLQNILDRFISMSVTTNYISPE